MGLFSRGSKGNMQQVLPAGAAGDLAAVGRAKYLEGQYQDASPFYLPGFLAAGSNTSGPEYEAFCEQLLTELLAAARTDGWASAGALYVAVDFFGSNDTSRPGYTELVNLALPFMRASGITSAQIPMFLQEQWASLR